ncbi:MAG: hypothetical protein QNJ47_19895 [Nostocaceae cyanobacterium]|nr:hypothetical protein [Nostocaceae cyanobacterium]
MGKFLEAVNNIHGTGLGKLITKKSDRITAKNRNRGKLWALHRKFEKTDPAKSARILEKNLSRKAENPRQLKEEGLSGFMFVSPLECFQTHKV